MKKIYKKPIIDILVSDNMISVLMSSGDARSEYDNENEHPIVPGGEEETGAKGSSTSWGSWEE